MLGLVQSDIEMDLNLKSLSDIGFGFLNAFWDLQIRETQQVKFT